MQLATVVNFILGILTVLAQISSVALVYFWVFKKPKALGAFAASHGALLAFVIASVAMLGSLTYSEIIGYEPCKLCWIQRILMYPQVLVLGLVVWGKHKGSHALFDTSLGLSLVGALVAGYHYLLQLGVAPALPCSAVGYSASCAQRFVMQFGYITIPLMAFSAFVLIALLLRMQKQTASPL